MTKIRIETTQPRPVTRRSDIRPWLRYLAIVVIAGFVALTFASPEVSRIVESSLREAARLVGL